VIEQRRFSRDLAKVGKLRTGWASRSALTATNNSFAPTSMPAASGCKIGNSWHRFCDFFAIGSSGDRPDAQGAKPKQTPNRDRRRERRATSHICTQTSDPRFMVGLEHQAPMTARAVAVIRLAPNIISPPAFLCTLFGKGQLHASGDSSGPARHQAAATGCQSSTRFPSGSVTQPNLPKS
jgi:hypothetical protein